MSGRKIRYGDLLIDPRKSEHDPARVAAIAEGQILAFGHGVAALGDLLAIINLSDSVDTTSSECYMRLGFLFNALGENIVDSFNVYECAVEEQHRRKLQGGIAP